MQTETLTAMLAMNLEPVSPRRSPRRYALGITAGALVAFVLMSCALHVNPALTQEAAQRAFWVREAFCAALGALSVSALTRLARPGDRLGLGPAGVVVVIATMWLLAAAALWSAVPQSRVHLLLGTTASVCPFLIALLAAPAFVALMWILKDLAPTRLRWAGATAGFAAGSLGALIYSLHCPELAPPFIGSWYLLGVLIPTGIGALLGPRLLRW